MEDWQAMDTTSASQGNTEIITIYLVEGKVIITGEVVSSEGEEAGTCEGVESERILKTEFSRR